MAGPLDISLKDKLLFMKSLLIPAFDPDNELETSKKRKKWLETRGVQKRWSLDILTELIERYGMVKSLEEAKAEKAKAERLLEKAEENERKQSKNHLFTLIVIRLFLSIIIMLIIMCRLSSFVFQVVLVDLEDIMIVLAKLLNP